MTAEHPPKTLGQEFDTGIVSFETEDDGVVEVTYVATAEGPDGVPAGFIDTLRLDNREVEPPDGINGWSTIGFVYTSYPAADPDVTDEPIEMPGYEDGVVMLEVRLSLTEDVWWTVPCYVSDER